MFRKSFAYIYVDLIQSITEPRIAAATAVIATRVEVAPLLVLSSHCTDVSLSLQRQSPSLFSSLQCVFWITYLVVFTRITILGCPFGFSAA